MGPTNVSRLRLECKFSGVEGVKGVGPGLGLKKGGKVFKFMRVRVEGKCGQHIK